MSDSYLFLCKVNCDKCWKKHVGGVGIFYVNPYIVQGKLFPFQNIWCGGFYVNNPKFGLPTSGKDPGRDWGEEAESIYEKVRGGVTY